MMKSEQKRLDRSTKTGVISPKSQSVPPSRPEVLLKVCSDARTKVQTAQKELIRAQNSINIEESAVYFGNVGLVYYRAVRASRQTL